MAGRSPAQFSQLLSQLRAPIFSTLPVAGNARNGSKYLKRRLRGQAIVDYAPQLSRPSVKTLTADVPWNKYAGWDGKEGSRNAEYMLPAKQAVQEGFKEIPRTVKPGPWGPKPNRPKADWLSLPKEEDRFIHVAKQRKIGKGAPKKGEGRRAQMGKKKKK